MEAAAILDFLKFFLPLAGAASAWFLNERSKRAAEEYERKEKKYAALTEGLQGFYESAESPEAKKHKARFLEELNKSWLYCPDDVIQKAYAFLATVHTDAAADAEQKQQAVGEFMLAIRKDLLSRKAVRKTKLTPRNFKHLRTN